MPYLAYGSCDAQDVVDDGMGREEKKMKMGREMVLFCDTKFLKWSRRGEKI